MLGCAQVGTLTGGERDEDEPVLDLENSTPNKQLFFDDRTIELYFDEWISLKNPLKEIFISPPLDYPLKVEERGKKVIIEFNEEETLKEETTYQISLGKAIADLTEGNVFSGFTFRETNIYYKNRQRRVLYTTKPESRYLSDFCTQR